MSDDRAHRVIAAAFESPDTMEALLRLEPNLIEARTGLSETPLHFLAVENQLRAVILLSELGAEINTLNSCGGTPLSEAASLGYEEMVEYLLSRGACISLPGQREPTLVDAVRSASVRVVQLLLDAGAPIDEQNDLRETALHVAAEEDCRVAVLELLLSRGANACIRRIFGETPLDVALAADAQAYIAVLINNGAPGGSSAA
jgi:ankyrin repeat protein